MDSYSEYLEYQSVGGERWDQLAFKFYGNALYYEPIVRANPYVPIAPMLEAGTHLRIPILEAEEIILDDKGDLPPWQR
jgi:hypothetical protein